MNAPNGFSDDSLGAALADMSEPDTAPATLWNAALEAVNPKRKGAKAPHRLMPKTRLLEVLVVAAIVSLLIGLLLPSMGRARVAGPEAVAQAMARQEAMRQSVEVSDRIDQLSLDETGSPALDGLGPRSVVRSATLALEVVDIDVVYASVVAAIDPARGEYVESASIAGSDPYRRSEIKLRVAGSRLDDVLGTLSGLGRVSSQSVSGTDVTDRVIDLDARLANEVRIEAELKELVTSWSNADLQDLLAVREQLNEVRGEIERLSAQRDGLGRLVSLAGVTVKLRTAGDASSAERSWWEKTTGRIGREYSAGLDGLSWSIGVAIRVLVGGALLWIPIVLLIIAVRLIARRQSGFEPPPALD